MSNFFPTETAQTAALEEQYETLKGLFASYLHDSDELFQKQKVGVSETFKRYLSMDELRTSPLHKKFYEDVQTCVEALAAGLADCPSPELAQAAAEPFFRKKPKSMEPNQRSWLIAAEALVIPLIPHLRREDAERFRTAYEQQYQWAEMMPKQRELYNALCDATGKKRKRVGLFASFLAGKPKEDD